MEAGNAAGGDLSAFCAPAGNNAPIADAGPDQSVSVGAPVTLDGSASSDVDGDSLTFSSGVPPSR